MGMEMLTGNVNGQGYSLKVNVLPQSKQVLEGSKEVLEYIAEIMTRLNKYEISNLSPDRVKELAAMDAEGRVLPKGFSYNLSYNGNVMYMRHPADISVTLDVNRDAWKDEDGE